MRSVVGTAVGGAFAMRCGVEVQGGQRPGDSQPSLVSYCCRCRYEAPIYEVLQALRLFEKRCRELERILCVDLAVG